MARGKSVRLIFLNLEFRMENNEKNHRYIKVDKMMTYEQRKTKSQCDSVRCIATLAVLFVAAIFVGYGYEFITWILR